MKHKEPPAWLARRKYFKRIARWQKPKVRESEEESPPEASNVVQFPAPRQRPMEMTGT